MCIYCPVLKTGSRAGRFLGVRTWVSSVPGVAWALGSVRIWRGKHILERKERRHIYCAEPQKQKKKMERRILSGKVGEKILIFICLPLLPLTLSLQAKYPASNQQLKVLPSAEPFETLGEITFCEWCNELSSLKFPLANFRGACLEAY